MRNYKVTKLIGWPEDRQGKVSGEPSRLNLTLILSSYPACFSLFPLPLPHRHLIILLLFIAKIQEAICCPTRVRNCSCSSWYTFYFPNSPLVQGRWHFRGSSLQSISTFLSLTFQRTQYPLLFSASLHLSPSGIFLFPLSNSFSIIYSIFLSSCFCPMGSHLLYGISHLSVYVVLRWFSLYLRNITFVMELSMSNKAIAEIFCFYLCRSLLITTPKSVVLCFSNCGQWQFLHK